MEVLEAALHAAKAGLRCALVTVIESRGSAPRHAGARMLVRGDGTTAGTIGGGAVEQAAIARALEALEAGLPARHRWNLGPDLGMVCGGIMEVFIEPLLQRPTFYLFGAGHVAVPTAAILKTLGFQVVVVDERPTLATEDRFPGCQVVVQEPVSFAESLATTSSTWILIISHSHLLDERVLGHLAPREWAWLGLIGSRTKVRRFVQHLAEQGVPQSALDRLSTPVGLDLGAETPEEIAVSIAAEVVCRLRGHEGPVLPMRLLQAGAEESSHSGRSCPGSST